MTDYLYFDLETYSACDLRAAGPYVYAEHPTTEITLLAYALGGGPVHVWDRTAAPAMPGDLRAALDDPGTALVVHNAGFERPVTRAVLGLDAPPERWHDTMAQALTLGLPASLDALGKAVGLGADQAKVKDGKRLIQRFAKPQPDGRRRDHTTDPDDWARFIEYARQDVEAMRAIHQRLPNYVYTGREYETWCLDQRINDRGIYIDAALVRGAVEATEYEQARIGERLYELTGGRVTSGSQRDRVLAELRDVYGLDLPDVREQTIQTALSGELPGAAREILTLRLSASRSSTAKYQAAHGATSRDGRLRGALQYYGAHTGRWSGRRLQPQNLPRPHHSESEIDDTVTALSDGTATLLYDDVMQRCASAARRMIAAPRGRKLVVSDLSNIEGRALAWLAGEDWKVQAFRAFDAGRGPDLYKLVAGKVLSREPGEITKRERNEIGKPTDLGLGFGGGVGAFLSMAAIYGTDMAAYWPTLQDTLDASAIERAEQAWRQRGQLSDTDQATWTASEAVKITWRDMHPATVQLWRDVEDAAVSAIREPDTVFPAGPRVKVKRHRQWLLIGLPSGRVLVYPYPQLAQVTRPSVYGTQQCPRCSGAGCGRCEGTGAYAQQTEIRFCAWHKGAFRRVSTYGGRLVENITQAVARDFLVSGMHRAEAAGYPIVLTVHDEIVTETPDSAGYNEPELSALLATPPGWATDIPLAAEGYEAYAFRKD